MQRPIPTQRCINYKKSEAPFFNKIENKLCLDFGLSISDLHKKAIRKLYVDRELLEITTALFPLFQIAFLVASPSLIIISCITSTE